MDSETNANRVDEGRSTVTNRLDGLVVEFGWLGLACTLWVFGLTLAFLTTGWPRWAFYASLVVGVVSFAIVAPRPGPIERSS